MSNPELHALFVLAFCRGIVPQGLAIPYSFTRERVTLKFAMPRRGS